MVRVFCADIAGVDDSVYERLLAAASATRRERAAGYRRREDAVRCVVAEALLRYACGGALPAVQADSLGKPRFPDRPELCFNLSHGGRWVVLAWSGTEVGIDVEPIRMDENRQALCRRFFSPEEQAYVSEDESLFLSRFFEVWTAKESLLKHTGTGLRQDLRTVNTRSLCPPLRLFHTRLPHDHALTLCTTEADWELIFLPPEAL